MINTVCFFEAPRDDFDKVEGFYRELFGRGFEKIHGPFNTNGANSGSELTDSRANAPRPGRCAQANYCRVNSVKETLEKAITLGARVVVPPRPVKGTGWFAVLLSPDGARVGLWQEDPSAS